MIGFQHLYQPWNKSNIEPAAFGAKFLLDQAMARSGQKDGLSRQTEDPSTEGEAALPWPRLLSFTIDIVSCMFQRG